MFIMSSHINVYQNVESTSFFKKKRHECSVNVFQFREKSFSILHVYFILLSVVLSIRGVISYKSFEADTSRNTSSTDRQNWLYSKQLRDGARMEIHSQQQIAQTEKYLDRNPQSCHINRHL